MHTKVKRFLLLLLALALLFGAGSTLGGLQQMRRRYDLTSEPVTDMTPRMALATQLLGWGRGILIDVVWIRLESLKTQGKYFELVQLADWACKLAPRFPQVWDFHAWNLAYNVSCRVDRLLERWDWVWAGIKLLRDDAISWNPNAFELYASLSTIIFHKIGQQDDNAHFFYKQRFATLVHGILGGGGDRRVLEVLASTPPTREELLQDEQVARVVEGCQALGFDVVDGFFDVARRAPWVPDAVKDLAFDPANRPAMSRLEAFARARLLKEELGLEPERMLRLMDEYGPFDWRSPYPYAMYWASLGLERLDEFTGRFHATLEGLGRDVPLAREAADSRYLADEELYAWHEVNLTRLLYMSLQSLVMQGRVLFSRRGEVIPDMGTDYRFADATVKMFEGLRGKFDARFEEGISRGYLNFLSRGVIEFYFMGDPAKSLEYFRRLEEEFPDKTYGKPFNEYVEWKLRDYMSAMSFGDARRLVRAYSYQYFVCIGCNADRKAQALEAEAKAVAKHFNEEATTLREMIRYDSIKESALVDILSGTVRLPPDVLATLRYRLEQQNPGLVERIMRSLEGVGKAAPEKEDVEEELKVDK